MVMMETPSGDVRRPFHNRQPVILDRTAARTWLDPRADYRVVLRAPPAGTLRAEPPEPVGAGWAAGASKKPPPFRGEGDHEAVEGAVARTALFQRLTSTTAA